jgi:hypothetical protein
VAARRLFDAQDDPESATSPDSVGAGNPDDPMSATFTVDEAPHQTPLWPPATSRAVDEPEQAGEHGWIVATLVLVAVVIAVVVGVAVLWAPRDDGIQPTVSAPASTTPTTLRTTTVPSTAVSTTAVSTTTVAAAAAAVWTPFVAPDRAFRADLPGVPDAGTFPRLAGANSYTFESGGVLFGIVAAPFAPTDPAAVQVGLVEAAASVLPVGAPPPGGTPVAFPGGIWVLDFRQAVGDSTVIGRAQVANGHRFVLTMTVPTTRVDDPTVTSDLVHLRNGFSATV